MTANKTIVLILLLISSQLLAKDVWFTAPNDLSKNVPNAIIEYKYGSFNLYRMDSTDFYSLDSKQAQKTSTINPTIEFDAQIFNPSMGLASIPSQFRLDDSQTSGDGLHLLQFVGPIKQEWLDNIQETGLRVIHYIRNNAYLVWVDDASRLALKSKVQKEKFLIAELPYQPFFKMGASIEARINNTNPTANREEVIKINIQIINHPNNRATKQLIQNKALMTIMPWSSILHYENITVSVKQKDLLALINRPDVYSVQEYFERTLNDEVQAQIVAGNLNGTNSGPSGTGYLPWLTGKGFSTNPNDYPLVDVVDDGIGNGSVVNGAGDVTLTQNGDGVTTRLDHVNNCTSDPTGEGLDGHGHININIVGGFDQRAGFPFRDPNGYQRGQGINPFTRLAGTRIFDTVGFDLSSCGGTDAGLIKSQQDAGSLISSNSWGCGGCAGTYDSSSQAFDTGVRDADLTEAGNQQMIMVFAAGNDGSGASTVGTPGNGKNMITVGASENQRPTDENGNWTDGCGIAPSGADNAMDIISFSSRGPVPGGRIKPEIIAPGTHIQGTASTNAGYTGGGVCDQYEPSGQTTFSASSGTSHSTPAVAGITSLYYYWLQNTHAIATPTPSLMKAYLIAHPTYLTGVGANDTLPSNNQGYGMPNMDVAFDNAPRVIVNETQVFNNTGETWTWSGSVADNTKPVRIVMTYTDAPGAVGTSPEINNIDLSAVIAGSSYVGNNFAGAFSVTGGTADIDNNYEAIFLPTGTNGTIDITVNAANIAGDGIPNFGDATDQDFSIVCYNCSQMPDFTLSAAPASVDVCVNPSPSNTPDITLSTTSILGFSTPINLSFNPALPTGFTSTFSSNPVTPGNSSTLSLSVDNTATSGSHSITVEGTAGGITKQTNFNVNVSLPITTTPSTTLPVDGSIGVSTSTNFTWSAVTGASSYDIEISTDPTFTTTLVSLNVPTNSHAGTALMAATTYYWRVRAVNNCGSSAFVVAAFETLSGGTATQCNNPNAAIPDNNATGLSDTMTIASGGVLTDLDISINTTHTYVGDLIFTLSKVSPATSSIVIDRPGRVASGFGCSGDNIVTTLDDAGLLPVENECAAAVPTIGAGPFSPNNSLTPTFNGLNSTGDWVLNVSDNAGADTGTLNQWCLITTTSGSVAPADYSDLASSYGVAKHEGGGTSKLGANWTADTGFSLDSDASDDDGIVASGLWLPNSTTAQISATSTGGFLACWFDWNNDGSFAAGEKSISQTVAVGTVVIPVTIPLSSTFGTGGDNFLESRCRFYASEPLIRATESATGSAPTGEVEDNRFSANELTPISLIYTNSAMRNTVFDVSWTTTTEVGTIGFNVYGKEKGVWILLNSEPIQAKGINTTQSNSYHFNLQNSNISDYKIEELTRTGIKHNYGPFESNKTFGAQPNHDTINWQQLHQESQEKQLQRQQSKTASFDFIKVKVNQTGIQRITYESLLSQGVDWQGVASDQISISFESNAVARHISSTVFGPGQYIEFIGQGTKTLYTKTNVYELALNVTQVKAETSINASGLIVDNDAYHMATVRVDTDLQYSFASPSQTPWFYQSLLAYTTPKSWDIPLNSDNILNNGVSANLNYRAWGGTDWPQQATDHHLQVSLNNQLIEDVYGQGLNALNGSKVLATNLLSTSNTVTFTLPGDTGVDYDLVQLDEVSLTYPSELKLINGRIQFKPIMVNTAILDIFKNGFETGTIKSTGPVITAQKTGIGIKVKGLNNQQLRAYAYDNNELYLFTDLTISANGVNFDVELPELSSNGFDYFVYQETEVISPSLELANTPVQTQGSYDYLILSHPDFISGLSTLVSYHQNNGVSVLVKDVNDVYAQYSHHRIDANAIKSYIKDAYNNYGISTVLLVGGDSYDYLDNLAIGSISYVPTLYYKTGELISYAPVDSLYTDINGDLVPDLPIGRLPVRTDAELQTMINKTINYATRAYGQSAIFATDRDDSFDVFSDQMINTMPLSWQIDTAYINDLELAGAHSRLVNSINNGVSLTNFFGHSSPSRWSFESLLDTSDITALNNSNQPTLVNQFGCWNTYYVMPQYNTMAHLFLQTDAKGAVAVMGASTLTESFHESMLGNILLPKLTSANTTIGEAILQAKQELSVNHADYLDVILGWTLLGDPLLEGN
jgi:subtilisin-like proprotein convertase family protein